MVRTRRVKLLRLVIEFAELLLFAIVNHNNHKLWWTVTHGHWIYMILFYLWFTTIYICFEFHFSKIIGQLNTDSALLVMNFVQVRFGRSISLRRALRIVRNYSIAYNQKTETQAFYESSFPSCYQSNQDT